MRITDIIIKNYRAFYGEHHFCLDSGKNLMLYGENGSGKSALFTALKDFLKSSVTKVNVEENIFIHSTKKNSGSIAIDVKESPESSKKILFELKTVPGEIISADKSLITDANKIKGSFDYRSLLRTHLGYQNQVDLFEILVSDILYHSINRFSTEEIGKEWEALYNDTYKKRQVKSLKEATKNYLITKFNPGLKQLLKDIEADSNEFIKYFGINVKIKLDFNEVTYHGNSDLRGNNINLIIDFFEKPIPKHQFFLNEARLSALAISLYLASIRVNPLSGALKVLILDDLLIGLDMSNRLPLLGILKDHFINVKPEEEFQIIMTTYDKIWYELVKNYFGEDKWKYIEIYTRSLNDKDFEIPIIKSDNGYLDRAKYYLAENDYKASAVYVRTEFERLVKKICDNRKLSVEYNRNQKEALSDDFWRSIKEQTNIDPSLISEIEIHRGVVMNPFSHYDLEKPEFKQELVDTINAVEKLGSLDPKKLGRTTFNDQANKITELERKNNTQKIIIDRLKNLVIKYKT